MHLKVANLGDAATDDLPMHFSKTYTQLLLSLPQELKENAIEYRQVCPFSLAENRKLILVRSVEEAHKQGGLGTLVARPESGGSA